MINDKTKKLGEALVSAQILSRAQLDTALLAASKKDSPGLIVALLDAGYLKFRVFEKFIGSSLGIKGAIIGERLIKSEILSLIPLETIRKHFIFPIDLKVIGTERILLLGMVDPLNSDIADELKRSSNLKINPVLISLPDFRNAMKHHFPSDDERVDISGQTTDENMVLIRPGGYEEEIAFQIQMSERTKQEIRSESKNPSHEIDLEQSATQSASKKERGRTSIYFGTGLPKFKEEILERLDLAGSDAKRFNRESYSRESLFKELPEVSIKPLIQVYQKTKLESKFEAIINALIHKGLITKRDILHSTAISYIFEEKSK